MGDQRTLRFWGITISKVYKSQYFPICSFLEAGLGCNPSHLWRRILAAQNLVWTGARKLIFDGCNTQVFFMPWLPSDVNPFVTTPISDGLSNILVSSLMQQDVLAWDNDIFSDLFNNRDADIIGGIPLRFWRQKDRWSWSFDRRGVYSVRSSYNFLLQSSCLVVEPSSL